LNQTLDFDQEARSVAMAFHSSREDKVL